VIRFRRPRSSPALRAVLLAGPPALAASGAVQIFILAGTLVASFWPSGIAWIYYAERVMQLPLGLVAALGSTVLLPALVARDGRTGSVVAAQNRAMEAALLLALPASVALAMLSRPIAAILFERDAFGPGDAAGTGLTLAALSLGLPFAALGKVLSQTLFAQGVLRGPMLALLAGIAGTVVAAPILGILFGVPGIAAGVSLGCLVHAAALAALLHAMGLWAPDRLLVSRLLRIACASLGLAAGLRAGLVLSPEPRLAPFAALCAGGLVLYAALAFVLGAVTRHDLRRLGGRS
jgi:putative peptidoglycan lipid II flippase